MKAGVPVRLWSTLFQSVSCIYQTVTSARITYDRSSYKVRYIPTWFPGAGFKRHALKTRECFEEMFEDFFVMTKERKV